MFKLFEFLNEFIQMSNINYVKRRTTSLIRDYKDMWNHNLPLFRKSITNLSDLVSDKDNLFVQQIDDKIYKDILDESISLLQDMVNIRSAITVYMTLLVSNKIWGNNILSSYHCLPRNIDDKMMSFKNNEIEGLFIEDMLFPEEDKIRNVYMGVEALREKIPVVDNEYQQRIKSDLSNFKKLSDYLTQPIVEKIMWDKAKAFLEYQNTSSLTSMSDLFEYIKKYWDISIERGSAYLENFSPANIPDEVSDLLEDIYQFSEVVFDLLEITVLYCDLKRDFNDRVFAVVVSDVADMGLTYFNSEDWHRSDELISY